MLLALAGALVTFLMWWFHFSYPDVEGALRERAGRLLLLAEFAPPFAMVFGLGRALIHKAPSEPELSGPMSAYLYQQDARKKWKVMILAATPAVANLMLMMATA